MSDPVWDVIATPVGPCTVVLRGGKVCAARFGRKPSGRRVNLPQARRWLAAWFAGRTPRVPLDLSGVTSFSRRVYLAVRGIPRGRTRTYGEVACAAGRPGAARAVGRAMARNPVCLFIP